jgi:NADH-quinone oxidoreductase subunit J
MDMIVAVYVCLGFMLAFGVIAIMSDGLITAAITLAVTSAASGVLMYLLGAEWAAAFEISVCSGLVTVIFISAVSLPSGDKTKLPAEYQDSRRTKRLPAVLIVAGAALMCAAALTGFSLPAGGAAQTGLTFGETLWETRQADVWGQMIALITGTAAIVAFFKESENR